MRGAGGAIGLEIVVGLPAPRSTISAQQRRATRNACRPLHGRGAAPSPRAPAALDSTLLGAARRTRSEAGRRRDGMTTTEDADETALTTAEDAVALTTSAAEDGEAAGRRALEAWGETKNLRRRKKLHQCVFDTNQKLGLHLKRGDDGRPVVTKVDEEGQAAACRLKAGYIRNLRRRSM